MPRSLGRLTHRLATFGLAALLAITTVACGDGVDAKAALEVTDVVTGWFDAGVVDGKNKLVPTVSFRIKNNGPTVIRGVQLNAVFRVIGDLEELGSKFIRGIDGEGLAPNATTETFVLRSDLGYTGEQPRLQMLQHGQFRDAQVEIFAKHGSAQWVKLAQYTIERQLLTSQTATPSE